jgi:hypothetical protein
MVNRAAKAGLAPNNPSFLLHGLSSNLNLKGLR